MKRVLLLTAILFSLSVKAQFKESRFDTVKCIIKILVGNNLKEIKAYVRREYKVLIYQELLIISEDSLKPDRRIINPIYSEIGEVVAFLSEDKRLIPIPKKQPNYIIKNW